jgi:hypothetical protein
MRLISADRAALPTLRAVALALRGLECTVTETIIFTLNVAAIDAGAVPEILVLPSAACPFRARGQGRFLQD